MITENAIKKYELFVKEGKEIDRNFAFYLAAIAPRLVKSDEFQGVLSFSVLEKPNNIWIKRVNLWADLMIGSGVSLVALEQQARTIEKGAVKRIVDENLLGFFAVLLAGALEVAQLAGTAGRALPVELRVSHPAPGKVGGSIQTSRLCYAGPGLAWVGRGPCFASYDASEVSWLIGGNAEEREKAEKKLDSLVGKNKVDSIRSGYYVTKVDLLQIDSYSTWSALNVYSGVEDR